MRIPDHLICLLKNLYAGQETTVRTGCGTIDWFKIEKAEQQAGILSPCLFNLCRVCTCVWLCDPMDCGPPSFSVHGILQVRILEWIYLWDFYFVPLIYISVSVPVPYCLDDSGFVVQPEVRQVDSSSSLLLSQDYFSYSRFFISGNAN